jgi:hypothetical protein
LSSVVLPLPRNPVSRLTGMGVENIKMDFLVCRRLLPMLAYAVF